MYVGLQTADTDEQRIAVLLSELERTGAFDRKLLVIIPTTGTGWINPVAARSLEMMYNGDTAMVGSQYSYLPSWISFLGDRQKSMESGRMMIDAIHERWQQLPPDRRPKLVLYGESLGSMAGQGAFGWLPDIARMGFSSVLWVGPPNASPLWRGITVRRDPGTPEVEPRYDNGRTVRFSQATDAAEIAGDTAAPWEGTRVLFLQHSSDPIVWWSEDLLFTRPDWLKEPPGRDRTASMRWYPIVTFWQVAADMTNASSVPGGHGHNYGDFVLDGWAAVAPPDGWTPDDTERIRVALEKTDPPTGPNTSARPARFARVGAGRSAGRLEPGGAPATAAVASGAASRSLGAGLVAITRAPLGLRPPASVVGRAAGLGRGRAGGARCRGGDGAAAGAGGDGRARPARRTASAGCCCASRSARCGRRRPRTGRRWAPSPNDAFGPTPGRLLQSAAFGLSHIADARGTGEPVLGTVLATGVAGWVFGWLYARSGSLAAPMLVHLAVNEAAGLAALACNGALGVAPAPRVQRPPRRDRNDRGCDSGGPPTLADTRQEDDDHQDHSHQGEHRPGGRTVVQT